MVDADFTNVTGVETLSYGNNTLALTLGSAATLLAWQRSLTEPRMPASRRRWPHERLSGWVEHSDDTVDDSASLLHLP